MEFVDLNRTQEIGASSFWVKLGPFELIIDAGLSPKVAGHDALPNWDKVEPGTIDAILLTHCHLDHVGGLPVLIRQQPQAAVFTSPASATLAPRMLKNSHSVMFKQREELNILEYPLFSSTDIRVTEDKLRPLRTEKEITLYKNDETLSITFHHAGHIPGAVGILLNYKNRKIFFTGDVLFEKQAILAGAKFPKGPFDTLVLETTRGATERPESLTRSSETHRLFEVIRNTLKNGGSCLIPSFALGRMQEILTLLHQARSNKEIPEYPIVCSGLGMDLVDILDTVAPGTPEITFRRKIIKDLNVRKLPKKWTPGKKELKQGIYVLSSGMLVAKTPSYRVAASLLGDKRNAICFVGYCAPDTPGGQLLEASANEPFLFEDLDLAPDLKAHVEQFDLSGHAQRDELLDYAHSVDPRSVVLTHGDPDARTWFEEQLAEILPKTKVINPTPGEAYLI